MEINGEWENGRLNLEMENDWVYLNQVEGSVINFAKKMLHNLA
jgi:hypothetical protein